MHPPFLLGKEERSWWEPFNGAEANTARARRDGEERGKETGSQAEGNRGAEMEVQPARHPSPARPRAMPAGSRARAERIMLMSGQGLIGQSDVLNQCSTCWVFGWEGLGRR